MAEQGRNIVNFEMSWFYKILIYRFPWFLLLAAVGITSFFLIFGTVHHLPVNRTAIMCSITGVPIFVFVFMIWKYKKYRIVTKLTIDRVNGEFTAYIRDSKQEVKFKVLDISEINNSKEIFKFCLKDGTWISWFKNEMNQKSLEEIIKSIGFMIKNENL